MTGPNGDPTHPVRVIADAGFLDRDRARVRTSLSAHSTESAVRGDAHAALGHLDAIRALRRTLTRRLAEIDAEPGNDTLTLADDLATALQRLDTRNRPKLRIRPGRSGHTGGAAV
jgi:hypothetical protein